MVGGDDIKRVVDAMERYIPLGLHTTYVITWALVNSWRDAAAEEDLSMTQTWALVVCTVVLAITSGILIPFLQPQEPRCLSIPLPILSFITFAYALREPWKSLGYFDSQAAVGAFVGIHCVCLMIGIVLSMARAQVEPIQGSSDSFIGVSPTPTPKSP